MATLQAISDVGRLRKINEDYVFFCRHPKDENVILLIVADGMGGKEQGDVASKEVVADVEAWFYQTDIDVVRSIGVGLTIHLCHFEKTLVAAAITRSYIGDGKFANTHIAGSVTFNLYHLIFAIDGKFGVV